MINLILFSPLSPISTKPLSKNSSLTFKVKFTYLQCLFIWIAAILNQHGCKRILQFKFHLQTDMLLVPFAIHFPSGFWRWQAEPRRPQGFLGWGCGTGLLLPTLVEWTVFWISFPWGPGREGFGNSVRKLRLSALRFFLVSLCWNMSGLSQG